MTSCPRRIWLREPGTSLLQDGGAEIGGSAFQVMCCPHRVMWVGILSPIWSTTLEELAYSFSGQYKPFPYREEALFLFVYVDHKVSNDTFKVCGTVETHEQGWCREHNFINDRIQ